MIKKPQPKSILSIDVGHRRIGLAGCDPLGITITSLPAINRRNFSEDIETLKDYCQKRLVKGLVIGIPLDENGMPNAQSDHCERYGKRIAKALGLPMAFVNEHSSTWMAAEKHNLHKDKTGILDSAAAAILLEQWLREGPELKQVSDRSYPTRQSDCDAGF